MSTVPPDSFQYFLLLGVPMMAKRTKRETLAQVLDDIKTQPTCLLSDAAIALGISRCHAYAAARNGTIDAIRVGRRWIVTTAPLREKLKIDTSIRQPKFSR